MSELPNPERDWQRGEQLASLERGEITTRLGPIDEPLALLSGGLANLNVRIGDERVLRIYKRDASSLSKEAWLLSQTWTSFRVPKIERVGDDFLLLEFVAAKQEQLAEHGAAIGRALAEIHQRIYPHAGFIGSSGAITEPMPDFVTSASEYVTSISSERHQAVRERVLRSWQSHGETLRALSQHAVLLHGDFKVSNLHLTLDDELLVLDWEFAYAGPALMDIGQLFRWSTPKHFKEAFERAYIAAGRELPSDWRHWASAFDLLNLVGLLDGSEDSSRRERDVLGKIEQTLAAMDLLEP